MSLRILILALVAGALSYSVGFYAGRISGHYKAHKECVKQFSDALTINVCKP